MTVAPYPEWKSWMYYANIFGAMPRNGECADSDGAVALTFGRNDIPDNQLHRVREILDKNYSGSHLAMLQYLANNNDQVFNPGQPNREIADVIDLYILAYRRPVAAQWELAVALVQIYGERWVANILGEQKLFCLWPRPGQKSYRSKEVLEDARNILPKMKYPILFAHDLHLPRVYMLARKIWDRPIVGFPAITRRFDRKSVQLGTTAALPWYCREALGRAHHILNGWV